MRRHLNLPNQLTILRLLLVPVIGVALAIGFTDHYQVAVVTYALAALTDTLDGRIARSRHQVTELGTFLDPLVDKIMVITVLVILVEHSLLPGWVVVVIFAREFVITGLRSLAATHESLLVSMRGLLADYERALTEARTVPVAAPPAGHVRSLSVTAGPFASKVIWRYATR